MTISFATQTVTVIRPQYITARGDQVPNWGGATEHNITGCIVQPMAGSEEFSQRDAVVKKWRLFAPYNADITEYDRVRHNGSVYEVESYVQRWPSPTNALEHTEVELRRVEG